MWQFPLDAIAPCSRTSEESEVESCEHQDNANIHCEPFPELVSEEEEIYTDYDDYHCHHVKHDSYLSAHFRFLA
jgi:mannitol-1-phosphate/altronate dehydrogenase